VRWAIVLTAVTLVAGLAVAYFLLPGAIGGYVAATFWCATGIGLVVRVIAALRQKEGRRLADSGAESLGDWEALYLNRVHPAKLAKPVDVVTNSLILDQSAANGQKGEASTVEDASGDRAIPPSGNTGRCGRR
jgi:hypothetical protein